MRLGIVWGGGVGRDLISQSQVSEEQRFQHYHGICSCFLGAEVQCSSFTIENIQTDAGIVTNISRWGCVQQD